MLSMMQRGAESCGGISTHLFITHVLAESIHGQQHLGTGSQGPAAHTGGQLDALCVMHHIDLHSWCSLHVEGDSVFGCGSGEGKAK